MRDRRSPSHRSFPASGPPGDRPPPGRMLIDAGGLARRHTNVLCCRRPFPAVLDEGDRPRRVVYPERIWCVLQLAYHAGQDVDALGDGLLVDGRVAEDETAGT